MEYHIKINHTQHTEVTREGTGEWDGDDIEHSHDFNGFRVVKSNDIWDFILNKHPRNNEHYLVYVLYSTGDSFGSENNCLSMIAFEAEYMDAKAVRDAIEADYIEYRKSGEYGYKPLEIVLPKSKRTITVGTGTWKGFFEGMNSVNLLPMQSHS